MAAINVRLVPDKYQISTLKVHVNLLNLKKICRSAINRGALNSFLEKITATEETVVPVLMEDLIAEGESDELEFKNLFVNKYNGT